MTATNIFYNFVGFRYSPPLSGKNINSHQFSFDLVNGSYLANEDLFEDSK